MKNEKTVSKEQRKIKEIEKKIRESFIASGVKQYNSESITVRELWVNCVGVGKPINWVTSYRTLIRYVSSRYSKIFQPTIEGKSSGTRYFMKSENIAKYIYLHNSSMLRD